MGFKPSWHAKNIASTKRGFSTVAKNLKRHSKDVKPYVKTLLYSALDGENWLYLAKKVSEDLDQNSKTLATLSVAVTSGQKSYISVVAELQKLEADIQAIGTPSDSKQKQKRKKLEATHVKKNKVADAILSSRDIYQAEATDKLDLLLKVKSKKLPKFPKLI